MCIILNCQFSMTHATWTLKPCNWDETPHVVSLILFWSQPGSCPVWNTKIAKKHSALRCWKSKLISYGLYVLRRLLAIMCWLYWQLAWTNIHWTAKQESAHDTCSITRKLMPTSKHTEKSNPAFSGILGISSSTWCTCFSKLFGGYDMYPTVARTRWSLRCGACMMALRMSMPPRAVANKLIKAWCRSWRYQEIIQKLAGWSPAGLPGLNHVDFMGINEISWGFNGWWWLMIVDDGWWLLMMVDDYWWFEPKFEYVKVHSIPLKHSSSRPDWIQMVASAAPPCFDCATVQPWWCQRFNMFILQTWGKHLNSAF